MLVQRSDGKRTRTERSGSTGVTLLPWQRMLIPIGLGVLSISSFWPSLIVTVMAFFLFWYLERKRPSIPGWIICFGAGLAWVFLFLPSGPDHIPEPFLARKQVHIQGTVQKVEEKPAFRRYVFLEDVTWNLAQDGVSKRNILAGVLLLVWERPDSDVAVGDIVSGTLRIRPVHSLANPGSNDSSWYWRTREVFFRAYAKESIRNWHVLEQSSSALRLRLMKTVSDSVPQHQGGGLVKALVSGDKSGLSYLTIDLFQRTALSHSLAQSGLHLGFVILLGVGLAWGVSLVSPGLLHVVPRQKLALYMAGPLCLGYMWLGQWSPSLIRAGIMFVIWSSWYVMGRRKIPLDGLFAAFALILMIQPLTMFHIGFQLSFLAVLGILLFWPLCKNVLQMIPDSLWGVTFLRWILGIFLTGFCANLILLPILLGTFHQMSPYLVHNIYWLPLLGFVILPLSLVGFVFSIFPWFSTAGEVLIQLAAYAGEKGIGFVAWLDSMGMSGTMMAPIPNWVMTVGYFTAILAVILVCNGKKTRHTLLLLGAALLMMVLPLGHEYLRYKDTVVLTMLDVGQGQALLVQGPTGKRVLIDGGGSWNPEYDMGERVVLPALYWKRWPDLDAVTLSHPHYDHMRGLFSVLRRTNVPLFLSSGQSPKGRDYYRLQEALQSRTISKRKFRKGDRYDLGGGASLSIIWPGKKLPSDLNNGSLVALLFWKGQSLAIFPGDVDQDVMDMLLDEPGVVEAGVVVLPHHGSKGSINMKWYDMMDADLVLASSGYLNRFGHPHVDVVQALKNREKKVLSTSCSGAIQILWKNPKAKPEIAVMRPNSPCSAGL